MGVLSSRFRRATAGFAFAAFFVAAGNANAQLVINEIDYDQVNADNAEFIELRNVGASPVNLADFRVDLVNGSNNAAYNPFALPAVSLGAGDYFVICANAATTINCDLDVTPNADLIQNGAPDGVRIVRVSDGVTIDGMAYEGTMPCCTEGTALPASPADDNTTPNFGYSRFPDGADTNDNSADFSLRCISPGTANIAANSSCPTPSAPVTLSINDATVAEGNGGTTTATFTVTLSSPAGAGGVTFDIATADGTATTADNDYVARSLTAQTIAQGASTFAFDVTVNGDANIEATETYFVNVTNVTGATVADGQGLGAITNDDAATPALSIVAPAATAEGNTGCAGGSTPIVFTVNANVAPASNLAFAWATQDGTAQDGTPSGEDNDYTPVAAGSGTINGGATSTTVTVQVACDDVFEANETFSAVLAAGAGYTIGTGSAQATILNDDVLRIGAVQGAGAASPLLGQVVAVRGIVTSRISNGFYLQSQAADTDADPNTSEGLFVFTSSVPAAAATVGNLVTVTGTVAEFVPATDPNQQPLTQLTTPTVVQLSTGNPLPAPVDLTPVLPSTTGGVEQLENLENMRVRAPTLRVVAPTDGNVSEPNATATTNGRFYGVIPDNARPFREPGLEVEDAAGLPSTIPRWDNNPEKINIESVRARSAANGARASIDVDVGATLSDVVGVLDYSFRNHRLTLDFDAAPTVAGGRAPAAVSVPTAAEVTVATYNLERFFDDVNDPAIGEPVLTAQAFQNRLAKASAGIRDFLRAPDILGVVEVENLATLQALATRINNDAVAAGQPNPQYIARLVEGNDVGGIDVGFLVKTAPVAGSTPRVAINGAVEQLGAAEPLRCPDNSPVVGELLNDRPSLLLNATVAAPNGATAPVTVIVNHLRSLGDVNSTAAATGNGACFGTTGNRVRAKRLQQAVFLANAIQARQTGSPNQNIVLVGDFNAFEFNDGFVDSMGVITGAPAPDNETVVPGDGVDLVTPDFVNLGVSPSAPADERYSFVFSGNAQNLDHVLVSGALAKAATGLRLEHARINADFGEDNRNDPAIPVRLSDHDPLVAFIGLPGFGLPDAVFANGFEPVARGAD